MPRNTSNREHDAPVRGPKPAVIPVIQEQATVTKRVIETGKVRIAKRLGEFEELVDVPHFEEEVQVERRPINQFIEDAPQVRTEGDTTIIPVLEERCVVEKRLFLVEELHVRKERKELHFPQKVKFLREEVIVERHPAGRTEPERAKAAKPR